MTRNLYGSDQHYYPQVGQISLQLRLHGTTEQEQDLDMKHVYMEACSITVLVLLQSVVTTYIVNGQVGSCEMNNRSDVCNIGR